MQVLQGIAGGCPGEYPRKNRCARDLITQKQVAKFKIFLRLQLLSPAKHCNICDDDLNDVLRAAFQAAHNPVSKFFFRAFGQVRLAMRTTEQGREERCFDHRGVGITLMMNGRTALQLASNRLRKKIRAAHCGRSFGKWRCAACRKSAWW